MEAARQTLRPLGLVQRGRSRTWLSDQAWWVIAVEFQPSGWSRGSYLNVGCMWLWDVKPHISFDEGSRIEPFAGFESEEQFRPIAANMVQKAVERVNHYRSQFPTIHAVSDYYIQHVPTGLWPMFNAGIAHGLSGRADVGNRLLRRCADGTAEDAEWAREVRSDAKQIAMLIEDKGRFRRLVSQRVRETRELQKLPSRPEVDFVESH